MEYSIQRGKGAFLVNACSGHELGRGACSSSSAVDSKVILTTPVDFGKYNVQLLVHRPPPQQTPSSINAAMQPLPAQVAADDELLRNVKATSAQQHTQFIKEEQRDLKKAISASKLDVERREQEQDQEERLEAILKQSQYEQSLAQEQEEKRLAAALQRSLKEEEIARREEERLRGEEEERLAAVLAASQQEEVYITKQEATLLERAISISQLEVSQHDKALEEVLAQSMHDVSAVDCELEEVLKLSMREITLNPEDLIQQALLLSMNEMYDDEVANVD
jgi:flagellar biosynthesis GTPase FlhF